MLPVISMKVGHITIKCSRHNQVYTSQPSSHKQLYILMQVIAQGMFNAVHCGKLTYLPFRSSEYAAAKEQFDSRLQRQSAALAKLKPDVLIAKLAKASREADDQAEALYDEYIAGSITIEQFTAAYCKKKTVAHARNLKSTAALQTLR